MPPKKRGNSNRDEHPSKKDFRISRMSVSADISDVTQRIKRLLLIDVPTTKHCPFGCGALLLCSEMLSTSSWCCNGFTQRHSPWRDHPPELTALFDRPSFGALSRIVNNTLSPAVISSFTKGDEPGIHYYTKHDGPPAMRLSGQLHAKFMRNLDCCWFVIDQVPIPFGTKKGKQLEMDFVHRLRDVLMQHHPFASVLLAVERFRFSSSIDTLHVRVAAAEQQLSAVYVGDGGMAPRRELRTHVIASRQYVQESEQDWEVLMYPLYFPHGDMSFCWFPNLRSSSGHKMRMFTYVKSVILHEPNFWKAYRLAQQFILDCFARAEQRSVAVWQSAKVQENIRKFHRRSDPPRSVLPTRGQKIYMPSTVLGSPGYQRRLFHEGLHLSTVRGNSHVFITFTANMKWPEIAFLSGHLSPSNRLDAVARAFVGRRSRLMKLLDTPHYLFPGCLGIDWFVMSTEWQQCAIPHSHLAVRFVIDQQIQPMNTQRQQLQLMDALISARLPPPGSDAHAVVRTFMMHGNPCQACLRKKRGSEERCRFFYPKKENQHARIDAKGFPIYRRSNADQWVVPHVLQLLLDLLCHINVEWTLHSGAIAYLYKYINKGVESSGVRISDAHDEIAAFRKARVLSASEACYRTLGFDINSRRPNIITCRISLTPSTPCESNVQNTVAISDVTMSADCHGDDNEPPTDRESLARHGLNELGLYLIRPTCAREMTICHFWASYYICCKSTRGSIPGFMGIHWMKRLSPVESCLAWIPETTGELYFLRLLLLHFETNSLDELKAGFPSFRDRAIDVGLFSCDDENLASMNECIKSGFTPGSIRAFFVKLCLYGGSVYGIWESLSVRKKLILDFLAAETHDESWDLDDTIQLTVISLASALIANGFDVDERWNYLGLPPLPGIEDTIYLLSVCKKYTSMLRDYAEIMDFDLIRKTIHRDSLGEVRSHFQQVPSPHPSYYEEVVRLIGKNTEQYHVFSTILQALLHPNTQTTCFHINGPAGCGKTFVCTALLLHERLLNHIGLACATTGVASINYILGFTGHSLYGFPIERDDTILSGPKIESKYMQVLIDGKTNRRLELIRAATLLIWDEISMLRRDLLEALDRLLQTLMGNTLPFGGKIIITLGDFRQLPPVDSENPSRCLDPEMTAYATSTFQSSVLSSPLWRYFTQFTLIVNERARNDSDFHRTTLHIGNGVVKELEVVNLDPRIRQFTSVSDSLHWLYETDVTYPYAPVDIHHRALLCVYNTDVDIINSCVMAQLSTAGSTFVMCRSIDSYHSQPELEIHDVPLQLPEEEAAVHQSEKLLRDTEIEHAEREHTYDAQFPNAFDDTGFSNETCFNEFRKTNLDLCVEYLNSLSFPNAPPHKLSLSVGMMVLIIRNLDPLQKLMNGVRVVIRHIGVRVLGVTRITDLHLQEPPIFLLPRISFVCSYGARNAKNVTRRQFPVRPCAAMTVHKSQAATMDRVVIDLRGDVFEHGQLYVAISRVRSANDVAVLLRPGQTHIKNVTLEILLRGCSPD